MTKTLIIGAGLGGLATALVLSRKGFDVELIERQPEIRTLGSGITLIGPALKALDDLGLLDQARALGFGTTDFQVCAPDGTEISQIPLVPAKEGLPGMMGMLRSDLHRLLLDEAVAEGVAIRTGTSFESITDNGDTATIEFADGHHAEYDLVIGADGVRSAVRTALFGPMDLTFRDQCCIRALLPRLPEIDREVQYHGIPRNHVGFTPTSEDHMYLYSCLPAADTTRPVQNDLPDLLRGALSPFGGAVAKARDLIDDPDLINYVPLETILLEEPWYRGRVALVGDAVHCPTPQLAAGAAMCLEDALVLGEELASAPTVDAGLAAYSKRRYDRCKYVVETSVQLSAFELEKEFPAGAQEELFGAAVQVLAGPR